MNYALRFLPLLLFVSMSGKSQSIKDVPERLSIFVDCPNTWCDMTFIRSEIKGVNFSLDNQAADVHILITSLPTGSGGKQFQLIFFGQNSFLTLRDTLGFDVDANATEAETREQLLYFLKSGLVPFIIRTKNPRTLSIDFSESSDALNSSDSTIQEKDPWDLWVFRMGTNGNFNADAVYRNYRYNGSLSANRITDKWKYGMSFDASRDQSSFKYNDGTGVVKFMVNNHNLFFNQYLVGSISEHWSWGQEIRVKQNTFSNYKLRTELNAGIEYNIYPYKEVNNNLFTIGYVLAAKDQQYYDTTIYDQLRDRLVTQSIRVNMNKNQKWGTLSVSLFGEQFLRKPDFYNLGIYAFTNIRITGGLSFNVSVYGNITRDQIFLPKGGATPQEILARQRQIASGYNYYTSFGINFRFGSKLNNYVNPRFDGM